MTETGVSFLGDADTSGVDLPGVRSKRSLVHARYAVSSIEGGREAMTDIDKKRSDASCSEVRPTFWGYSMLIILR